MRAYIREALGPAVLDDGSAPALALRPVDQNLSQARSRALLEKNAGINHVLWRRWFCCWQYVVSVDVAGLLRFVAAASAAAAATARDAFAPVVVLGTFGPCVGVMPSRQGYLTLDYARTGPGCSMQRDGTP